MKVTDNMVRAAAQAAYGIHYERYQAMMRKALDAALDATEKVSKLEEAVIITARAVCASTTEDIVNTFAMPLAAA